MGDISFQNNMPDALLSGKELPPFKFELERSRRMLNTGIYEAIDLSAWVAGNPVDVLATNFNKKPSLFEHFPRKDIFISPNE